MEYVALGISAITLILAIVIIIKVFSAGKDGNDPRIDRIISNQEASQRSLGDEFARNRAEMTQSITQINAKIDGITRQNYEQQNKMLETVVVNLKDINEASRSQNERIQNAMTASVRTMQESNEKKLEEMRQTVDEKLTNTLKERLDLSFKNVSENLEKVYKSLGEMKELASDVSDIQRIMNNVKTRGTWGEVQLGNILEQTMTREQYELNVQTKKSGQFVEYAVKIPSRDDPDQIVWLPIDSKFPLEDYMSLSEAAERADREAVEKYGRELEKRIVSEAKTIRDLYINVPETTDFAILFLPMESLYAEILRRPGLVERLQNEQRVMICGPTTITAFLNTLRMGFRTIALDKRAAEVWKVLGAAKSQYETFEAVLAKAKKKVDEASNVLDDAQKRNSIIQKKLRNVETVESGEAMLLLGTEDDDIQDS